MESKSDRVLIILEEMRQIEGGIRWFGPTEIDRIDSGDSSSIYSSKWNRPLKKLVRNGQIEKHKTKGLYRLKVK